MITDHAFRRRPDDARGPLVGCAYLGSCGQSEAGHERSATARVAADIAEAEQDAVSKALRRVCEALNELDQYDTVSDARDALQQVADELGVQF